MVMTEGVALALLFGSSSAVLLGLLMDKPEPGSSPRHRNFREIFSSGYCTAFAGTACFNWTDTAKVRMQAESMSVPDPSKRVYTTFGRTMRTIVAEEGISSLLSAGIVSACYRDILYSGIRYGAYPIVKRVIFDSENANVGDVGILKKMFSGAVTGGFGALIANPTDVVKIRMQREAGRVANTPKGPVYVTGLSKGHAVRYHNGFQAMAHIIRAEGFLKMYAGSSATVIRAAMGTGAQLAAYDHTKYLGKKHFAASEGPMLHAAASLVSGLTFATAAAPADVVKSRYMSEPHLFKNPLDCLVQLVRHEGPLALFRGWTPSAVRICSLFVVMTPIYEQIRQALGLGWFG
ncbi:hypothetical protein PTSG_02303 [Salpingoeca rosetta]|uniref:Uncharacterized protein n=1 Tax=Salpingoeca rosetta (strain ATCC 50818 / BSB-021) TaxID=946362 RepID=F2U1T6_SALR5|nr:uncharacterized protein PTSG_02303 [Salpingoeca rosetta]EGD81588.1 hypothetical protein PTSG_02303 [Salpingoeca rosetta]|eukprot:XP_004996792.1 hypothetical protein PTSG_02303 [Salpingoeca rosetta]